MGQLISEELYKYVCLSQYTERPIQLWEEEPQFNYSIEKLLDIVSLEGLILLYVLLTSRIPPYVVLDSVPYVDKELFKMAWDMNVMYLGRLVDYMKSRYDLELDRKAIKPHSVKFSKRHIFYIRYITALDKIYTLKYPIKYDCELRVTVNTTTLMRKSNYTEDDIRKAPITIQLSDLSHPHVSGSLGILCTGSKDAVVALLDDLDKLLETVDLESMYGFCEEFVEKILPELRYIVDEEEIGSDYMREIVEDGTIDEDDAEELIQEAVEELGKETVFLLGSGE